MRYQIFSTQPGSSITTTREVVIEILAHLSATNGARNLCSGELKNPERLPKFPKSHTCKCPAGRCEQVYRVTRIQVSLGRWLHDCPCDRGNWDVC